MITPPQMVGSMVGMNDSKTFNQVDIKPETISRYLGDLSITGSSLLYSPQVALTNKD